MATYNGNFLVVNNTGGNITNCIVSHICSGQPTATLPACNLSQGGKSTSIPFTTETTSYDKWSISFLNGGNELRTAQKDCGYESEDTGEAVLITLNADNYDIKMPVSSSCNGSYQQT